MNNLVWQLNLDSAYLYCSVFPLFWKHNFQNVLNCITKLVRHINPDDGSITGSSITHFQDKQTGAQKG